MRAVPVAVQVSGRRLLRRRRLRRAAARHRRPRFCKPRCDSVGGRLAWRLPPIAASLMLAAVCAACAATPARIARPGPSVTALPDPCSLVSFGIARRLVPGLSRRDISHDGYPDTGRNRIPGNTQCIWGNGPVTAPGARIILIGLQLFSGDSAATGSYQAHQDVLLTRATGDSPVGALGNEAWVVYYTGDHTAYAKVVFRWGNEVAYIEYSEPRRRDAGAHRQECGDERGASAGPRRLHEATPRVVSVSGTRRR